METPLSNDSLKASLSLPVGGHLCSFRRGWQTNKCSSNMLNIITNGYILPFHSKPSLVRFPLIQSEYKAHQKDQALATCIQSLLSKNAIERTLCPVRALRYYLDRTTVLRGSRSLLFISCKKGHTSDIRPTTLSSWLRQTILLCYKQADQQALDLVQVKAHDIRAFAASKAFYGGVSVDQIMQACHWKAHNTFTNFYLKDLIWSDNNNMYLGPAVAAQVLDPYPQTSYPRKEKRGGGGTSATTKSSRV